MHTPDETSQAQELVSFDPTASITVEEWSRYQGMVLAVDQERGGVALAMDGSPLVGGDYEAVAALVAVDNALRDTSLSVSFLAVPTKATVEEICRERALRVAEVAPTSHAE